MSKGAYLAEILRNPDTAAETLYRWCGALLNQGFTEDQAMELTKFVFTLIIGFGGQEPR